MVKILSIDPSGTGTTGICLINGNKTIEFKEYKEKDWRKHYEFITSIAKVFKPNILLYEDTNYIHKRTKDGLSLFRLLGAIDCLAVKKVNSVNVLKVKGMTKQLLARTYQIKDLEYLLGRGKGWMFNNKRVSIHCLEAFIVYYLYNRKT